MIFIFNKYKKTILIVLSFIILIVLIIIIKIIDNNKKDEKIFTSNTVLLDGTTSTDKSSASEQEDTIIIHITGSVNNEGIIEIKSGSRIADAIEKAGGLTADANLRNVNLAYELEDGQKLYIPNLSDDNIDEYIEDGISDDVVIDSSDNTDSSKPININKADITQLESLNGIGESIASAIIQYRNENGDFSSIEDIKNVPGIGDSKFENIKDFITVR